jgi:Ring finger domain
MRHIIYMDDYECPICLEPLENTHCQLPCKHKYHTECYTRYAVSQTNERNESILCPLCRNEVIKLPKKKDTLAVITFLPPPPDVMFSHEEQNNRSLECLNKANPIFACLAFGVLISSIFLL